MDAPRQNPWPHPWLHPDYFQVLSNGHGYRRRGSVEKICIPGLTGFSACCGYVSCPACTHHQLVGAICTRGVKLCLRILRVHAEQRHCSWGHERAQLAPISSGHSDIVPLTQICHPSSPTYLSPPTKKPITLLFLLSLFLLCLFTPPSYTYSGFRKSLCRNLRSAHLGCCALHSGHLMFYCQIHFPILNHW